MRTAMLKYSDPAAKNDPGIVKVEVLGEQPSPLPWKVYRVRVIEVAQRFTSAPTPKVGKVMTIAEKHLKFEEAA